MSENENILVNTHHKSLIGRKRRSNETMICKRLPEKNYTSECISRAIKKSKKI
jgi:hypothetical protein